jgi:hypothetical protein
MKMKRLSTLIFQITGPGLQGQCPGQGLLADALESAFRIKLHHGDRGMWLAPLRTLDLSWNKLYLFGSHSFFKLLMLATLRINYSYLLKNQKSFLFNINNQLDFFQ